MKITLRAWICPLTSIPPFRAYCPYTIQTPEKQLHSTQCELLPPTDYVASCHLDCAIKFLSLASDVRLVDCKQDTHLRQMVHPENCGFANTIYLRTRRPCTGVKLLKSGKEGFGVEKPRLPGKGRFEPENEIPFFAVVPSVEQSGFSDPNCPCLGWWDMGVSKGNGGAMTKGNDQSRPRKNPRASKRTSP